MEVKLLRQEPAGLDHDALVLVEYEGRKRPEFEKTLAPLYDSGEITGKSLEFTLLHRADGFKARRVLIAGAGKPEKFDTAALRKLAAAAVRFLKEKGVKHAAIALEAGFNGAEHVAAVAEAALMGAWEPNHLKT